MFYLIENTTGECDDRHTWLEVVASGKLAAYFENKRLPWTGYSVFVLENAGRYNQTGVPVPENPESLFPNLGDKIELGVLTRATCNSSSNLFMTVTSVEDVAFENAIAKARAAMATAGWTSLELKLPVD